MGFLKVSPNLHLEVAELNRLFDFTDKEGFRLFMNSVMKTSGLFRRSLDPNFTNGRVIEGVLNTQGNKTIRISPLLGVTDVAQFIVSENEVLLDVPADNKWYWLVAQYAISNIENGSFSIDTQGNLTGSGAELTKILRGSPNFVSKIKFDNSTLNNQEYDILEIIGDNNAILVGDFVAESNLKIKVVGTFTPGVFVQPEWKYPFNYDSCTFSLLEEVQLNTRPVQSTFTIYLARIRSYNQTITIEDKRSQFFDLTIDDRDCYSVDNPLVGVESVRYGSVMTPQSHNLVDIAWGIRTSNFTLVPTTNTVTLNSGLGGKYKDFDLYTTGELNGWRLYTKDGKYGTVITSNKNGSSINLVLDVLNTSSFFTTDGSSLLAQTLFIVPPVEEVSLKFLSDTDTNSGFLEEKEFTFPSSQGIATIKLPVLNSPSYSYRVYYRYKDGNGYSEYKLIPSNDQTGNGYLTEDSFDSTGNLKPVTNQTRTKYTSSNLVGFITLNESPNSFNRFSGRVDRYKPGVEFPSFGSNENVITLNASTNASNQVLRGSIFSSAFSELYINLATLGVARGSEFVFHLSETLTISQSTIVNIVQDFQSTNSIGTVLKRLTISDIGVARNSDAGVSLHFVFDGRWYCYQGYENPRKGEIISYHGNLSQDFDSGTGMGVSKGWIGCALCNGMNGTPNLSGRFIIGYSPGNTDDPDLSETGKVVGNNLLKLTPQNLPPHSHNTLYEHGQVGSNIGSGEGAVKWMRNFGDTEINGKALSDEGVNLEGKAFDNRPESVVLAYVKRLY